MVSDVMLPLNMHLWAILACCCVLAFAAYKGLLALRPRMALALPPSPPARFFSGHLHLLSMPLHRCLHKLAQAYGPILFLRTGAVPTVVVSSALWAREFLLTHERDFANRPRGEASRRLFYDHRTLVTMEHGPQWRETRKLYTVHMLCMRRVEMFKAARREEVAMAMAALKKGGQVQLKKVAFRAVGNMMSRMLVSKRLFGDGDENCGFAEMVQEMAVLFGAPIIGDLIPCLSWLDSGGYKRRMTQLSLRLDSFLEGILADRLEENNTSNMEPSYQFESPTSTHIDKESKDTNGLRAPQFLDMLFDLYKDHKPQERGRSIKAIILDLLSAGTETTTTTIEWAMAELLKNPECMKKLQGELVAMVKHDLSLVKEKDFNINNANGIHHIFEHSPLGDDVVTKLPYLQAVIKETLRLHPPIPILVRQMSKNLQQGKQVGEFVLPSRTKLLVNVWALRYDTTAWGNDAQTFNPDRFLTSCSTHDLHGKHYEFLPFGSGRRGCPGMNLGLSMVGLTLANFVHFFDWRLPEDCGELDMSEGASRTAPMAVPLQVIPSYKYSQTQTHC